MDYNLEETLSNIFNLNFSGHIIPHTWYQHITLETGKPDLIGMIILADIIYWYRPVEIKDEVSGKLIGFKKKFKADMLQRNSRSLAEQFGFSQRQVSDALRRLVNLGLIIREIRQIESTTGPIANIQFLAPIVKKILEIQVARPISPGSINQNFAEDHQKDNFYPIKSLSLLNSNDPPGKKLLTPPRNQTPRGSQLITNPLVAKYDTYTKNTTKITTKNRAAAKDNNLLKMTPGESNIAAVISGDIINKPDNLISNQPTSNQIAEIENRIKNIIEQGFNEDPQTLRRGIIDASLNPKNFSQCGSDFNKKLNTIFKSIRERKFILQINSTEKSKANSKISHQQEIKIKWNDLQNEVVHWKQMLDLNQQKNNSTFIKHLEKLVSDSEEKLKNFEKIMELN